MSTADRHGDNRWNRALDALAEAWNRAGPDTTLAWVTALARSDVTPEGVVVVEIAAREDEPDPTWEEALADFEAAEPVTLIRPHRFEAIPAHVNVCKCGKGCDHLIHTAARERAG